MSVSALPNAAPLRSTAGAREALSQVFARSWGSLTRRHWLLAIALGVLFGFVHGTFSFLYSQRDAFSVYPAAAQIRILINIWVRWVTLMTGLACLLALTLAVVRDLSRRGAIRPRDVASAIVVVAACGSLIIDPIAVALTAAAHSWLNNPAPKFTTADWLTTLSRMYTQTGEKIFTFVGTVTLAAVYYFKDSRTSDALARVQLGLSQAHRRRLIEELRTAQATVDPEVLFATFDDLDRRFESEPELAERLLDALIGYLRAALPAQDDAIGTLGQQAALVRAWLEIATIRSGGRLRAAVDMASELHRRPCSPALILPLVALLAGDAIGSGRDVDVRVSASSAAGRLSVAIEVEGCDPPSAAAAATLDSLRQRLGALYGSGAELSLVTRAPASSTAKIVIDDPGDA